MAAKTKVVDNKTKLYVHDSQAELVKDCIIPLARWCVEDKAKLADLNIGVRLAITDDFEDLADSITDIPLIAVDFIDFEDGRVYSQVKMLRGRWHYKGEILALNAHLDQLQSMLRCGVDSFEMASGYSNESTKKYLKSYNICYQHAQNNKDLIEEFPKV